MTQPWDPQPGPTPPARVDDDPATSVSPPVAPVAPPSWVSTTTPAAPPPAPASFSGSPLPPIESAPTPPDGMPRFVGVGPTAPGAPTAPPGSQTFTSQPFAGQPFAAPASPPLRPEAAPYWAAGSVPPTPPPVLPVAPTGSSRRGRGWVAVGAVVGVAALLTAGFLGRDVVDRNNASNRSALTGTNTSTTSPSNQATTPTVPGSSDEPVVAVAKALSPAVVQIQTQEGLGSGVIYDSSGLIVTNQHVVGTAKSVQINLSDGSKLQGQVQGADASSDIAVVKIDGSGKTLTAAKLASGQPAVGSIAVAIGSPFGLTGSVTAGVVSAVDRPIENERNVSVNMIQTDAPINPGNSGGALANRNGEVIGINAEIYSQKGENNGIGFAIPIETAKRVADEITSGKITDSQPAQRASLGVSIQASPNGDDGAYVANVVSGSGADQAGIQAGDLIVGIDGQSLTSPGELGAAIGDHQPGDTVTLEVVRDNKTGQVEATLGSTG